jgi:Tfp pilus assembly protein PilF
MATRTAPNQQATIEEALTVAVQAVDRGDLGKGKAALNWVLQQDPENTTAWLWMACCVTDDDAKQDCYRRVSSIISRG